jgi:hypothetical protein
VQKFVIALLADSGNDAIRGIVSDYASAVRDLGVPVVEVGMTSGELEYSVKEIAEGNVAFAITWLGIGQDLEAQANGKRFNVWDEFSVPLLKIHGDIPAYFPSRHGGQPLNSVNLYMADEFLSYRRNWMPRVTSMAARIPPMALAPVDKRQLNLKRRREGRIVFLKNGNAPEELRDLWKDRLPSTPATYLRELSEICVHGAFHAGPFDIAGQVARYFTQKGIDPNTCESLIPFFVAQLDDYLRRRKSELIATALLDLPVVVQGSAWGHVNFSGRAATLLPGQDFAASSKIFAEDLAIIDMSPNVDTGPHERVMRAAGSFAVMLTNRQGWMQEHFPGYGDLQYEFRTESIQARVEDILTHSDRYIDLGVQFGEQFRDTFPRSAVANQLVDLAELAALQCSAQKPILQPYFAWSS